MKKYLLSILICLLMASQGWGATWYANALNGQNINYTTGGAGWFATDTGDCTANGTQLTWNNQSNGDIFESNACAGIIVNVDPRGTTLTGTDKVHLKSTGGSGFTVATSTSPITINADITGGNIDTLEITGSANANPALTIVGNIVGSGTTTWGNGVSDTHTVGTVVVTGNITGGAINWTGYGYYLSSTGSLVVNGNVTNGNLAIGLFMDKASTVTVNGDCTGGSTNTGTEGCVHEFATGSLTVTGNIIHGAVCSGAKGRVIWAPSSAQKYIKHDGGGTAIYAGAGLGSDAGGTQVTAANTATNISTTGYFIKKDDGVYTQGTAAGGGSSPRFGDMTGGF